MSAQTNSVPCNGHLFQDYRPRVGCFWTAGNRCMLGAKKGKIGEAISSCRSLGKRGNGEKKEGDRRGLFVSNRIVSPGDLRGEKGKSSARESL